MSDEIDVMDLVSPEALDALDAGDGSGEQSKEEGLVDRRFGGDTDKLATAYENLEKKFGQQGNEIGELKQMLSGLIQNAQSGDGGGEGDGFLQDLQTQVEAGGVDLVSAFKAFGDHIEKRLGSRLDTLDERTEQSNNERIWSRFVADNPKAKHLERVMATIASKKPHLVVQDKGEGPLIDSLQDLMVMAEDMVRKQAGGRNRSVDSGRSRRVMPSRKVNSRGRMDNERLSDARQTDSERDWGKVIESML